MDYKEKIYIDLSSSARPEVPVNSEWEIDVPAPRNRFKNFFYRSFGKLDAEITVEVCNISVDKRLILNGDPEDLIFLRSEGRAGNSLPFSLKELKTYCRVIIDPNVVADCKESEKPYDNRWKGYRVSFDLSLKDKSGEEVTSHHVVLDIHLQSVHLSPTLRLNLDEKLSYSSEAGLVKIGYLLVANPVPDLMFTPGIDVSVSLKMGDGNKDYDASVLRLGDEAGNNKITIENLVPKDSRCTNLSGKKELAVPVFVDMRKLRNPLIPQETLQVRAEWSYHHHYDPAEYLAGHRVVSTIEFLQDSQGAEMVVSLIDEDGNVSRISDGQRITLPEISFFAEGSTVTDRKFRISNLATDTSRAGAGVHVCGLTVSEKIEGVVLKDRDGRYIEELFDKSNHNLSKLNSATGVMLRNGTRSLVDFALTFDPAKVMLALESSDFRFVSVLKMDLDYIENPSGADISTLTPKHFSVEIIQPLYLKPNPRWLCIDYGSSAIVCKYDGNVLSLKSRKEAILRKALGNNAKALQKDTLEDGTMFLSSDILLHTPANPSANRGVSSLCSERKTYSDAAYDKLGVFLSPTFSMIVNEVLRQLPCLKILVGNRFLPDNPHYRTFDYDISNSRGGVDNVRAENMRDIDPDKSLLVIDSVFRESYEALLGYFVIPEVEDINLINRLVLTYPNTYTPRHLDALRKVVDKVLPSVRELEFVSESDAVAAYYLENWTAYHPKGANPECSENILVYDMGAGTLDLSLIRKTKDADGAITMEIIAKIGTCKAGNYLDYVLAEIVCALMGDTYTGGMALASTQTAATADIGKERTRLKDFIKNRLKPQISKENRSKKMEFRSGNGEHYKEFEISQVLEDKRFKQFLTDVTEDIVGRLADFADEAGMRIDTVLMSGRSSLFPPLREYLASAVRNFNENTVSSYFVRLDEPVDGTHDVNRQKVAVTEGAMAMMERKYRSAGSMRRITSKRVYASFGVAYQDFGRWHYVQLLDYRDIPAGFEGEFTGKRIDLKNMVNIPSLIVIQTYLDESATERALNESRWDYLAEMERIPLDGTQSESLMMKITEKNNIILYLGHQRTRGQAPKTGDLTSDSIKKSVWPVTI